LHAQSFREITTRDGLPQSFISGIEQDDSSFVWIGSRNGLVRFDGLHFKLFQHDPYDSNSIYSNIIGWVNRDHKNRLFIQSDARDIDIIDPLTEKITHYIDRNTASSLRLSIGYKGWLIDAYDKLWSRTEHNGIDYYDKSTNKVTNFNSGNAFFPNDTITGLTQARNDNIWLVSSKAISMYDQRTKRFTHRTIPFQQDFSPFYYLSDAHLHERKNGEMLWHDRNYIYLFHPSTNQFRRVPLPAGAGSTISGIRTFVNGDEYLQAAGAVYRYNDNTGFRLLAEGQGPIISFMVDKSGLIWLGTNGRGIRQIDLTTPRFRSSPYNKGFAVDMLKEIFLIDLDRSFGHTSPYYPSPDQNYFFRSAYDRSGKLLLGTRHAVISYDWQTKTIAPLPQLPDNVSISGLTVTNDNQPLVSDMTGRIFIYRSSGKTWELFIDSSLIKKATNESVIVQSILADEKYLWATTEEHGLIRINLATREISSIRNEKGKKSIPTDQLIYLLQDPTRPNLLWIASYQGLICMNKNTLSFELLSQRNGLPDNNIYGILADREGNLWLPTNKGLCRFDPVTRHQRVFRSQHGLPGDEFNRYHQLQLPDGRLIFGGVEGWTVFDPLLTKKDEFDPSLAFTGFIINNSDQIALPSESELRLPPNALSKIDLPYDLNTLTINFAALEYSQPHEILYRYRLEGYDENWILAGNNRQASYTKLPPGKYTFVVNATNISGKWSTHIRSIPVRISAPWWATRLAYLVYAVIIGGLVWTFIRLRVSRLVVEKEVELREKETSQLKELDEMKTRFFSNITHEFRTPLTLIMGPAEQLKTANAGDVKKTGLADLIITNAKQLLNLVNRLLDLSRLEAKAMKLREQEGMPGAIIGSIVNSFEMDAKSRQVELNYQDRTNGLRASFFIEATERIVYNLLSNAMKFTPAGGRVDVSLRTVNQELILEVKDTGTGIPGDQLPYIFDRFYQVHDESKEKGKEPGSGIGLAMVKELIEQMNGSLDVESATGDPSGTIFTVTLPYTDSHTPIENDLSPAINDAINENEQEGENNLQVLLVEDNMELAGFVISILSERYAVHHVTNGASGLQEAISIMPDLIISDIMMPGMNGLDMLHELRKDIRISHIPVILLTAKTTQEDLLAGLSGGAQDYLTKPFHPTELLLRVQNLLDIQQKIRKKFQKEITSGIPTLPEPVEDIFLTRIYELIDQHLDDSFFGVDQLAAELNMSRSSLHRKLKTLTGTVTTEVVRNHRLKKAAVFLLQGFNSSDTAYKSGFSSPAYFTKCFREQYGMTPGDYIKRYKTMPG